MWIFDSLKNYISIVPVAAAVGKKAHLGTKQHHTLNSEKWLNL